MSIISCMMPKKIFFVNFGFVEKKKFQRLPGFEPGSPTWQSGILATRPHRIWCYVNDFIKICIKTQPKYQPLPMFCPIFRPIFGPKIPTWPLKKAQNILYTKSVHLRPYHILKCQKIAAKFSGGVVVGTKFWSQLYVPKMASASEVAVFGKKCL